MLRISASGYIAIRCIQQYRQGIRFPISEIYNEPSIDPIVSNTTISPANRRTRVIPGNRNLELELKSKITANVTALQAMAA
jgi:hypothetical protein